MAAVDVISSLVKFLEQAKQKGSIASYDTVSLSVHSGHLNGFILIRGNRSKLDELRASEMFDDLAIQAHMVMTGVGIHTGVYGEEVTNRRTERLKKLAASNFM